jgi:hypothetical protein
MQVVVHYEDTDARPVLSIEQAAASGSFYPLPQMFGAFSKPGHLPQSIAVLTGETGGHSNDGMSARA